MKKCFLLFAASIWFSILSYGQISQGGLPISFDNKKSSILQSNIPIYTMPLFDVTKLESEDISNDYNKEIPWRFGNNISVNIDIISGGMKDILPNGDKIWRTRIYSRGALTMNFVFDKYILPKNAKLFLYNDDKTKILGAFTDFNNQVDEYFATTLIEGEAITIEYFEPANVDFQGQLHLNRVTHGYRNVLDFTAKQAKAMGSSGACEFNVKCPLGTGWDNEIKSVCMLVTNSSGFCTGSLINNVNNDGTPYVLTANHCSTSNNFASWVFWFNWQSTTCTNPTASPAYQSISGSVLKARSGSSDFCLVQMNQTPPLNYNLYYEGWDRSGAATQSTYAIHHPAGDIKKISHATSTTAGTYSSAQCWNVYWTINGSGAPTEGVTEGGSSGSPIFDANHRVIGQLYGGPSLCSATGAASVNDYYGRFSYSWDSCGSTSDLRLQNWLDPQNTNPPFINGFDPNNTSTPPLADFTQSDTATCTGVINFTDQSSNMPVSWLWNFGDGTTSTVQNPAHTYAQSGYYSVSLNATNQYGNNIITKTNLIHITLPAMPTGLPASRCGAGTVTISASGTGVLKWYDSATAGNSIGTGNSYTTPSIAVNTTYFVEDNVTTPSRYFGNTQSNATGGGYSTTQGWLNFDALSNFKLVSVEVNASGAGNRLISLINSSGTTIASTTVNLAGGVSRITLNFDVPAGTGYKLSSAVNANLWRTASNAPFPYTLANVASITGSASTNGTSTRYYFFFNWEVQQYGCVSNRTPVMASINSGVVAGTSVANPTNICGGTTSTLTLNGYTGNIQWQQSQSATGPWFNVTDGAGASTPEYTTATLNTTTWFRAFISSAGCPNDSSNVVSVNVTPAAIAGTASSSNATICAQTSANLILTGSSGSIQWQISTDGNTWNDETSGTGATTGIYTSPVINATSYFRARISLAPCGDSFSNVVTIGISANAVGGTATVNNNVICTGSLTTLSLSGQAGTIRWQRSTDASTWADETAASSTMASYLIAGLTTTSYFRARISQGNCADAFSNAVTITVNPLPIGGNSNAAPTSMCSGNSSVLTISGFSGNIQWQQSENGSSNWTDITGETNSTFVTNLLVATTFYRAMISTNGCSSVYSNVVPIIIFPEMTVTVYTSDESAAGAADGAATVSIAGGAQPFTYNWSNGATTQIVSGLSAGNYSVVVLDANNCMVTSPVTINTITSVTAIDMESLKIYPNPATKILVIESYNPEKIEITDMIGKIIYQNTKPFMHTFVDMSSFESGMYSVKITSCGKMMKRKIVLQK